jgi:catechol 2,3-dioxygenase-like lactoylglutathione lyase family enzyme
MLNNLPPFAVERIDHIVFRVVDLEKSIAFYGNVLGCHVVKRRDDLGLIHLRAGASMIDLVAVDGRLGRNGGAAPGLVARNVDHLCLRIEPFNEQAIIEHLASHNVQPIGLAEKNFGAEGNGLSLYFYDPDGNLIELKGPSLDAQATDEDSAQLR